MKFWDTSAIVPLCVHEPAFRAVRAILTKDPSVVVWWATRTECISALARQAREGVLTVLEERQARGVLDALATTWTEVQPGEAVRRTAERLLGAHSLRAADAFQLAAALEWCGGVAAGYALVSFDARVREAAQREGFSILPLEAD